MHIVVLGGGVAGLSSALALARAEHRVTLLERDRVTLSSPSDSFHWARRGVAHFQQPHAFLPRGRWELKQFFPDIFQSLLDAGSIDYWVGDKIRGTVEPEDDNLSYLSVRRPVIEWALRKAVLSDKRIAVRSETKAADLIWRAADCPTITGVVTDSGESLSADLVVDAQGRTTRLPALLAEKNLSLRTEAAKSYIVYYSRYFQTLPGKTFPRGPWLTTPRGDLGFAGFSSFTGDNGTFALVLAIGSWDKELRILQHKAAWDDFANGIPLLAQLAAPDFATPVTPVLAMGELQNTFRHFVENGRPKVRGLIPVGDTLCHTDPTFALGLSFAIVHARVLQRSLQQHGDDLDAAMVSFWNDIYPETRERYDFAVAFDEARAKMWQGERLNPFRADGCYPMFTMVGASLAALRDDEVFRKTVRRHGFLDRLSAFDSDTGLHRRIEKIVEDMRLTMPKSSVFDRVAMLESARRAMIDKNTLGASPRL